MKTEDIIQELEDIRTRLQLGLSKMKTEELPDVAYATDKHAEVFYDDDPAQVAQDYFQYEMSMDQEITIWEGTPYIPDNQDEIDFMGDEYQWLVKDIKPFQKYRYDENKDEVIEVEDEN